MNQLCVLALAVCLSASAAAKLDKFHVIKTDPVKRGHSPPDFEKLRKSFIKDNVKDETEAKIQFDDNVVVVSDVQELKLFLSNPGHQAEEILFRDFMSEHALIVDFHVRNQGLEEFRSVEKKTLSEVEEHFFNADKEMRTTAILGMIHSSSTHDNIQWLGESDLRELKEGGNWTGIDFQEVVASAILMRVMPGDVFSVRIAFREVITPDLDSLVDLYSSHLTIHMGPNGVGINGLIESPNYPENYPDNANIKWLIRLPNNHNWGVEIDLIDFETESCCDLLYVYDGATTDSPVLGAAAGSYGDQPTTTYTSTGTDMLINFVSDAYVHDGSFSFNFTSKHVRPGCAIQSLLVGEEGDIVSPNYPIDYPEEAHCSWMIVTPRHTSVALEIIEFELDNRDEVRIYDVGDGAVEEIVTLTGYVEPYTIHGSAEAMEIQFVSTDHIIRRPGFNFHYYSEAIPQPCDQGVVLEGSSGEISSDHYPISYENNQSCSWQIIVEEGDVIYLDIDHFRTELYHDYLYIYDGPSEDSKEIAGLSGDQGVTRAYITTQNIATLKFVSDYVTTDRGFHIGYESYAQTSECSSNPQLLTGEQGYLTTPNYPAEYPSFSACTWLIQTDADTICTLNLIDVDLGINTDNLLTVYDGSTNDSRVLFSSDHLPRNQAVQLNATTNQALLTLTTWDNFEYRGILVSFEQLDMKTICSNGIKYDEPQGELDSALYPGYYPSGYSCRYYINTPVFTSVNLLTKEFELGPDDTLTAYDGNSENADQLFNCSGTFCNLEPATSNQMFLVFQTKSSNVGFSFNYYGTAETCPVAHHTAVFNPNLGYIISPGFPEDYRNNQDCEWSIVALSDQVIEIDVQGMQTEFCCDFLKIYDGNSSSSRQLASLSGTHSQVVVTTTGNHAFVTFKTDFSVTYMGFSLQYTKYTPKEEYDGSGQASGDNIYECTAFDDMVETTNTSGYILSPNYATNYANNLDYCWLLEFSDECSEIELTFSRVHTELDYDFIQVFEGSEMSPETLKGEISGVDRSEVFIVPGSTALIRFHTDESITEKGFVMQYIAE